NLLGDLSGDGRVTGLDASLAASLGAGLHVTNWHGDPLDATIYDGRTETADGMLHVFAPDPSDMGAFWTVQGTTRALFGPTGKPELTAIHQGTLADCYLLAALGALTITHPEDLANRITLDATGFAVQLKKSDGHEVVVHV